jgi:hypothetical protein
MLITQIDKQWHFITLLENNDNVAESDRQMQLTIKSEYKNRQVCLNSSQREKGGLRPQFSFLYV